MTSTRMFGIAAGVCLAATLVSGAQAAPTYTWSITSTFLDWANMAWSYNIDANIPPDGTSSSVYNLPTDPRDGGTVTGTFVVDAAGGLLSYNITTGVSSMPANFSGDHYLGVPGDGNFGGGDMFSLGGNDVFFYGTSTNYLLDLNIPDLSADHTLGTTLANYGGIVSELAANVSGDPNWPNYSDGFFRYDFQGGLIGPQGNLAFAFNGNGAPDIGPTLEGPPTGLTTIRLQSINGATTDTPEPMSLALLGSGLVGLGALGRRFNRRK